jgi:hypothetical protein
VDYPHTDLKCGKLANLQPNKWPWNGVRKEGEIKNPMPLNNKQMPLRWHTKGYLLATKGHHNEKSHALKINKNFLQNALFPPAILDRKIAKKQEFVPKFSVNGTSVVVHFRTIYCILYRFAFLDCAPTIIFITPKSR